MSDRIPDVASPNLGGGFTDLLGDTAADRVRLLVGGILGLAGYFVVLTVVPSVVLGLGYALTGGGEDYAAWSERAANYEIVTGMLASHLALALLVPLCLLFVRYWYRRDPRWAVSVHPGVRWRYLIVATVVALVVMNLVNFAVMYADGQQIQIAPAPGWWAFVIVLILVTPFQAAGEEFVFRGFLLQSMAGGVGDKWIAAVLSSLIFALLHGSQNVWLLLDRFAFGMLAATLVIITGGLEAAIAAHVANNWSAFGWAIAGGTMSDLRGLSELSAQDAMADIAMFGAVGLAVLLVARAYKLTARVDAHALRATAATPGLSKRRAG